MQLPEISELITKGNYNQALEAIEKLEHENKLEGLILKSRIFERKGDLQKALETSEKVLEKCRLSGTKLQRLNALINHGYANSALRKFTIVSQIIQEGDNLIQDLEDTTEKEKEECQASLDYLSGNLKFHQGHIPAAIKSLEKSLTKREELNNPQEIAETSLELGFVILQGTGKQILALEYFNRSLSIYEELSNKYGMAASYNRIGNYYYEENNFDTALDFYQRSLAIYQEAGNNKLAAVKLFNNIGIIYREKEEYYVALNYLQQSLDTAEKIGDQHLIGMALGNIGGIYRHKGELDLALEYYQRGLKIKRELGEKLFTAWQLGDLGRVYAMKGQLNLALDYHQQSLTLNKETGSETSAAYALKEIAHVYTQKGEPELALEYLNQSLKVFNEKDNKEDIARCLIAKGIIIGRLYGKLDQALHYLEEGWDLTKEYSINGVQPRWGSFCLFHLILTTFDLGLQKKAEKYHKQMQEIREKSKNLFVDLRARFIDATVLKMSKRGSIRLQAQQKFQEIVDEAIIDHEITILATLNLCELLMLEMKISEAHEELLEEINKLSNELSDVSYDQDSPLLIVMSLILRAKLTLVEGNLEEANNLLDNAVEISEEKKMGYMLSQAKHEKNILQAEIDKWEEMIQTNAPIIERIEHARVVDYVSEAKKMQESWVRR